METLSNKFGDADLGGRISHNEITVIQTDKGNEEADARADSMFQGDRYGIEDGFANIGHTQQNENETFKENCQQGDTPVVPHAQTYRIGKVGIETHTRGQCKRQIREKSHAETGNGRGNRRRHKDPANRHAGILKDVWIHG